MNKTLYTILLVLITFVSTVQAKDKDDEYTLKDVRGTYGFMVQGEILGLGPLVITGYLKMKGNGTIPEAVRTVAIGGMEAITQTFTCTFNINPNGTGKVECPIEDGTVDTFDFVFWDGTKGFYVVTTMFGVTAYGEGRKQ